jgi:hypothetical protein|uniref:Uncharacterized protein n=1 Tax=Fagus sylvatica TaxID=28930 RepID=A0A2N9GEA1_FAGSY
MDCSGVTLIDTVVAALMIWSVVRDLGFQEVTFECDDRKIVDFMKAPVDDLRIIGHLTADWCFAAKFILEF